MGEFPEGVELLSPSYQTLAKTQLIWNDRCQHLGLTWRRPGGENDPEQSDAEFGSLVPSATQEVNGGTYVEI